MVPKTCIQFSVKRGESSLQCSREILGMLCWGSHSIYYWWDPSPYQIHCSQMSLKTSQPRTVKVFCLCVRCDFPQFSWAVEHFQKPANSCCLAFPHSLCNFWPVTLILFHPCFYPNVTRTCHWRLPYIEQERKSWREKGIGKKLAVWSKPDGWRVCLGKDIWLLSIFYTLVIWFF